MDDNDLDKLFSGDLTKLIPLPKRVVRLFISSTFTDMTLERNSLMERVYPRMKKYCRERYALDFQVVDMRWGVRDEATDDHQTVDLCSREIDNCRRVSLGPNFIALIGDKYGYRPLLNKINSVEFRSLRRCLIELDMNTDFLDTWYKEDLNATPAEYVLQPISSILKNFTNKSEPELQLIDQRVWQAIQERLHELLMIGSQRLARQGRMSERDQLMKYSISVTEREVIEGCLGVAEAKLHCLVYIRTIVDLRSHLDECLANLIPANDGTSTTSGTIAAPANNQLPQQKRNSQLNMSGSQSGQRQEQPAPRKTSLKIGDDSISLATFTARGATERRLERTRRLLGRYVDLTKKGESPWQVDEEAQEALSKLKHVELSSKLASNGRNLTHYQVAWLPQEGMSVKCEQHKQYLNDLTEHLYANLSRMVRNAVRNEQSRHAITTTTGLIGEVLQHSHYARNIGKTSYGRQEELDFIRSYILCERQPNLPMFLFGVDGSGKTSVLARAASLARDWILDARWRRRPGGQVGTKAGSWTSSGDSGRKSKRDANNRGASEGQQVVFNWSTKPCIIMRFCCTTPNSSSMSGVLTSACRQLQFNFYQFGPLNGQLSGEGHGDNSSVSTNQLAYEPIPDDFVRLVFKFRQLLDNCQHPIHRRRLFVIILDSIDRVSSPAECSMGSKYSWLTSISRLPPNVKLIVSCSSEEGATSSLDYRYLKRHFLQVYYHCSQQQQRVAPSASTSSSSSCSEDEISSGARSSCLISNPSSPLGSSPIDDSDFAPSEHLEALPSGAMKRRFGNDAKYLMLKRLIMPAVRWSHTHSSRERTNPDKGSTLNASRAAISVQQEDFGDTNSQRQVEHHHSRHHGNHHQEQQQHDHWKETVGGGNRTEDYERRRRFWEERRQVGIWILHVRPCGLEFGRSILRRKLSEMGRGLTQEQWAIVERSLGHCSRPIFVKLTFGEVSNWKSYSMQGDTRGLTFGAAWLADSRESTANANGGQHNSAWEKATSDDELEMAIESLKGMRAGSIQHQEGHSLEERDEFKWQLLAMEQQWLNYLDYEQQQQLNNRATTSEQRQEDVVIRIGAKISSSPAPATTATTVDGLGKVPNGAFGGGSASTTICHLSDTVEDAISQLFARIELKHGYLLTKHSLSYITAARSGICENELEDILSLDDVVLDDVFQYHLPPVRRIPPLLWTRIRNDLPDYLSEREADGIVVAWHHNQFKLVTQKRYLADPQQVIYIHSIMADYFMGKWADKNKPFKCTRQQIQMAAEQLDLALSQSPRDSQSQQLRSSLSGQQLSAGGGPSVVATRAGGSFSVRNRLRSSDQHDQRLQWVQARADRRVPRQPLFYLSSTGGSDGRSDWNPSSSKKVASAAISPMPGGGGAREISTPTDRPHDRDDKPMMAGPSFGRRRYNLRKLTELPFHLMRATRFADLASQVLFNYNWLVAALNSIGLQSLFADFNEALECLQVALIERQQLADTVGQAADVTIAPAELATAGPSGRQYRQSVPFGGDQPNAEYNTIGAQSAESTVNLRSMIQQVRILRDTLRLSSSVIQGDWQMLAPQLIGRLLPSHSDSEDDDEHHQRMRHPLLGQLVEQCDQLGCADCSLLPVGHCLQSADGLQLSSLEGHSFAVMSMAVSSDQRHLLTASNKFLVWDISTGQVVRDIETKLNGAIIQQLKMSFSNELAIGYTSNNVILALDILTQQVVQYEELASLGDGGRCSGSSTHDSNYTNILGLELFDKLKAKRFCIWTALGFLVFRIEDKEFDWDNQLRGDTRATSQGHRISITPEYAIDLSEEIESLEQILSVSVCNDFSSKDHDSSIDLIFVICRRTQTASGQLELKTVQIINNHSKGDGWPQQVSVWAGETISGTAIVVDEHNKRQLFVSDSKGNLFLRRRRTSCWSKAKLLHQQNNLTSRRQSGTFKSQNEIEANSIPFAIETEPQPALASGGESCLDLLESISDSRRKELTEFERLIDAAGDADNKEDDEIKTNPIFATNQSSNNVSQLTPFASDRRVGDQQQVRFVKLYLQNEIVVVQLGSEQNGGQPPTRRVRSLAFPRNYRSICVEQNKSPNQSVIMQAAGDGYNYLSPVDQDNSKGEEKGRKVVERGDINLLIVAANKMLLVYCLLNEQLLRCFEAHSRRITQLMPLAFAASASASGAATSTGGGGNLTLASASMDKTVKIWNLANVRTRQRDELTNRLAGPIELLGVSSAASQWPIAACLARGELAVWNWQTMKILARFDANHLAASPASANAQDHEGDQIVRFKFSSNNRFLIVATLESVYLLLMDARESRKPEGQSSPHKQSTFNENLGGQPLYKKQLPVGGFVRKMKFIAQDSRALVFVEWLTEATDLSRKETTRRNTSAASSHATQTTATNSANDAAKGDRQKEQRLFMIVICLSIPDGSQIFSVKSRQPAARDDGKDSTKGVKARNVAPDLHHIKSSTYLPAVTLDHHLLVCVEEARSEKDGAGSVDLDVSSLQRHKSSASAALNRPPMSLAVYSTRDGLLVRSIDLSQLEISPPEQNQSRTANQTRTHGIASMKPNIIGGHNEHFTAKKATSAHIAGAQQRVASISGDQFTRLKAINYRERSAIICLLDDESGACSLVDVGTRQLVAYYTNWSGKMSSDGRYGLSQVFGASNSSRQRQATLTSHQMGYREDGQRQVPPVSHTTIIGGASGGGGGGGNASGLQLLDLRQFRPIKTLVSVENLKQIGATSHPSSSLSSSSSVQSIGRSQRDILCGFTRPNNAYVFLYESRLKRLLLIRLRDSQVVANYKLSVAVVKIKCSSDGLALILGLGDGSIMSLAIVDTQASDTLARLALYPSRKNRTINNGIGGNL